MSKKLIGVIASFALVLSMVAVNSASALTAGDIAMLQAAGIISASQAASLNASLTPAVSVSSGYNFATDLTVGSKGADVTALQQMLVSQGHLSMPAGVAYGYFGAMTKAALVKFQLSKGITPAAGYFGPKTRAMVNSSGSASGPVSGPVVSGTDLSVSLAPTSPMASALVEGQAVANLAEFTFMNKSSAPAVVTNVALQRVGVAADTSLSNVYLYNGAMRLTDSASVSSGKISFNSASGLFTVPAGSSMTVSVKSDIAASSNGQLVAVALTGVTASVPVSAVYPVTGASMSIFSASDIATVALDLTAGLSGNIQAGSLNQTVFSTALSLSGRAVYLRSLALKVIGSIPSNALQNLKLYVAGVQVASAAGMDASGMVTFDLTSAPYKIDSSRTLEVRADVVSGSSRSFTVSLQNTSDLQIVDSNYNVGITATLTDTQTTGSWVVNATTGGSVTVQQDTSLSAGDVITGSSNVALGRYTLKAYGEDMKISYLWASTTLANGLQNVALYANGVQIGSTQTIATGTAAGATGKRFSLGSSLIIGAGQTVTVEIRADLKNSDGTNMATGTVVYVSLAGETNNTQGSYAQQLTTVPAVAGILSVGMTVKSAGVTFAKAAAYSDQTMVPNTNNVKLGSYILQTDSSEPVRITSLTVTLGGAAGATTNVSNLRTSENPSDVKGSPTASNNFNVDFTLAANSSRTIDVFGDLSTTNGVASTTMALSGYGVNSNVTISQSAVTGQTLTVGAGSLAVPTLKAGSGYSPVAQFVVGNTSSVLGVYNFKSTNGDSTITELTFAASSTAANLTSVSVDGHAGQLVSGVVTITGLNKVISTSNAGVNVPVTVTYNTVGSNGVATNNTVGLRLTGMKYTSGNSTVSTTTLAVDTNLMTLVASKPTLVFNDVSNQNAVGGLNKVARVTVSADAGGPVSLLNLPLSITTSGTTAQTSGTVTVKVNGSLVATTDSIGAAGTSSTATGTISFTGGYDIAAGGSVVFDIYDSSLTMNTSGDSVASTLGSAALFTWNDVNGSSTQIITGSALYNYPSETTVLVKY